MPRQNAHPRQAHGLSRRELLHAGLAASVILSAWPLARRPALWCEEVGPPKRGGVLRVRGQPSPALAPGLAEWSLPIDQLGQGAKYYRYDPQEARQLLAEAGYPKG